ncbi:MAG: DoxX family protein [Chloroflexota bacterium]|nr:DoxX family protein [Chloroflexota bacterium]
MVNVGLLILRLTIGGLMAGHGAQKLFGWFGGFGVEGTGGWLESMGLRPGKPWALLAGGTEFGGGVLTALGFLNPLGPLGVIGSMAMASATAHRGKPIWVTAGGPELPVVNIAAVTAIALAGSGTYSLDEAAGTELPRWVFPAGAAAALAIVAFTVGRSAELAQTTEGETEEEPAGGKGAEHPV